MPEPPLDDAQLAAYWSRIRTGAARAQHHADHALTEAGVPAQWFPVLHLLLVTEGHRLPMSTLARDALMTSGGFTKLADRMASEGLIDRRGSDVDRRVVHATLTAAGLDLARRAAQVHAAALRAALRGVVDAEQLRATAEVLGRLGAVDALPPPQPDGVVVETARDPALPERRGRGRERE